MKPITITDLIALMGETFAEVHSASRKSEDFESILKKAEYEAKLAKQIINGADIIIRTDKMSGRHDRIDRLVDGNG